MTATATTDRDSFTPTGSDRFTDVAATREVMKIVIPKLVKDAGLIAAFQQP